MDALFKWCCPKCSPCFRYWLTWRALWCGTVFFLTSRMKLPWCLTVNFKNVFFQVQDEMKSCQKWHRFCCLGCELKFQRSFLFSTKMLILKRLLKLCFCCERTLRLSSAGSFTDDLLRELASHWMFPLLCNVFANFETRQVVEIKKTCC